METVLKAISDWIKSLLTAAIMSNLSGLFDDVNTQVGNIAQQVGTKPSSFEPRVFAMIEALSRNVVLPIAGIILTFIACYELIEMITQHNNMAQFEPALLMKWIFKTAISVWMISNTFDIIMAVFDVTQQVVANSSGIISGNTRVNDIGLSMLQSSMMQMDVGPLFGLFLQSFFIGITMRILSIVIFVIVYGRMIEIYMMVSLAPVPMATWGNHEQSHVGQNYLRSLFALGFQGFLILICVAIYAVLLQNVAISGDAAKNAQTTQAVEFNGSSEDLKLNVVYGAAHGTKCFTSGAVATAGDTIVLSYIDEFQFAGSDAGVVGVPNSDSDFGAGYAEGKVLMSKRVNADYYSKMMAEKAGSTVSLDANYDAIQNHVNGMSIADAEALSKDEKAVDAVSGATLVDTAGYVGVLVDAAK